MASCPQDPVHHGEGDVWTHTMMVVDALVGDPWWRNQAPRIRAEIFTAAVLHDIAKPGTVTVIDGRVRNPRHARRGESSARRWLWEQGIPPDQRERVVSLIRFHLLPFRLLASPRAQQDLFHIALTCGVAPLLCLARADARGRKASDTGELLEAVNLAGELACDYGCDGGPFPFANDHSRFLWFRRPDRDPCYAAHELDAPVVTMISGLPGAGKDHWLAANYAGTVVSLDVIRRQNGIGPTGGQRAVVRAGRDRLKSLLRAGESCAWNATCISPQVRGEVVDLAAAYGASVEIVVLEAQADQVWQRNATRDDPIPRRALDRLIWRWQPPDLTEAHRVIVVT
jgi:predicted kinase